MLNTEGERVKKSYLAIDYPSLDQRIESSTKQVKRMIIFDNLGVTN